MFALRMLRIAARRPVRKPRAVRFSNLSGPETNESNFALYVHGIGFSTTFALTMYWEPSCGIFGAFTLSCVWPLWLVALLQSRH
jgi:hypothetical protein